MNANLAKQTLGIGVVLALTAGCGPGALSPDNGVAVAGAAMTSSASASLGYFDLPYDIVNAGCVTLTGDNTDPDGDNIPTSVVAAVECSELDGATLTTVVGTIVIDDDDSLTSAFGYSAVYDLVAEITEDGSAQARGALATAVEAGELGSFSIDVAGAESAEFRTDDGMQSVAVTPAWSVEYTPSAAWTPGEPLAEGALEFDGAWTATQSDGTAITAAVSTVSPLQIDPSCSGFASGALEAVVIVDGMPQIIQASWTACQPALEVGGQPVDLPEISGPDFQF